MATSGTYTFDPTFAAILDEAFERCGLDPQTINVRHVVSAKRSMNLLLRSELSNDQINLWKVSSHTPSTPAQGATSFSLPSGSIDVLEAITRDSEGNDTPMLPIGRADWLAITDKDQEGRPDRFWVQRSTGTKTFNFWQAQPANLYTFIVNVLKSVEDVGELDDTIDVDPLWQDVVAAGLAARLAEKWKPERADRLEMKFEKAHKLARASNIERASLITEPRYGRR